MNKDFFSIENNDFFSNYRGLDLQELLLAIANYNLEYRNTLNLSKKITFGVEIEYENFNKYFVDRYISKHLPKWKSVYDSSLIKGGEINSPILIDKLSTWEDLNLICRYLTKHRVNTMQNSAGHIHIGANILGSNKQAWLTFIKLYLLYKAVINRFVYGEKINARKGIDKYSASESSHIFDVLSNKDNISSYREILSKLPYEKYFEVNFRNVKIRGIDDFKERNTIEFRSPNTSTSHIVIQNNINLFTKMLLSCKNNVIDTEFLDFNINSCFNDYLYCGINIRHALEFVDIVFDNNLDKLYFLRQYLKDFEEDNGTKTYSPHYIKTKKFTK